MCIFAIANGDVGAGFTYLLTFSNFPWFLFNFLFLLIIFVIRRPLTQYKKRITTIIKKNSKPNLNNVKFDVIAEKRIQNLFESKRKLNSMKTISDYSTNIKH